MTCNYMARTFLTCLLLSSSASSLYAAAGFAGPLAITSGGTYTGHWESLDPLVPAVSVKTEAPVIIENCEIRGRGHLISIERPFANVTIRNCAGAGLSPRSTGAMPGRFVTALAPQTLEISNNSIQGTSGIYINGNGSRGLSIKVTRNRAENIEGRLSDGADGYAKDHMKAQFVQLNKVPAARAVDITWNQVVNMPGKSRVEDNINIYMSSGSKDRPILIENNYIQGAYPADPAAEQYSGGGIIVDGGTDDLDNASAFITVNSNQVLSTSNYGIAVAAGHDIIMKNNTVMSAGELGGGVRVASANVGAYVANWYKSPKAFFNNVVIDNMIAWKNARGEANNSWFPDCGAGQCKSNESLYAVPANYEAAEYKKWQNKLKEGGVTIGPQ